MTSKTTSPKSEYVLISPCRDEARFAARTIESVLKQTIRPAVWVIVDDGSTDATPTILRHYAERHDFIRVITLKDRGHRRVGGGVIDAFNVGLEQIAYIPYEYLCKLDLDLDLPAEYFELLIARMQANPRLGTCSGKTFYRIGQQTTDEVCGNENSMGATKFYRRSCFEQIGGFVPAIMWDGIDCHRCRMIGWHAESVDDPRLRFEHLRPMGSSQTSILTGRMRHGHGQYFMGTSPTYIFASAVYRLREWPYLIGSAAMLLGYFKSALLRKDRYPDVEFRKHLQAFQRRCLHVGKTRAVKELELSMSTKWQRHQLQQSAIQPHFLTSRPRDAFSEQTPRDSQSLI